MSAAADGRPEDRLYASLLLLFGTVLLGLAGWALGQPLPEPARWEDLPQRAWALLLRPPAVAAPPTLVPPIGGRGPGLWAPSAPAPPPSGLMEGPAETGFPEGLFDDPGALQRWLGPLGHGEGAAQALPVYSGDRDQPLPDWLLAAPTPLGAGEVAVVAVIPDRAPHLRAPPTLVRVPVLEGRLVAALLRDERARLDRCVAATRREHPGAEGRYEMHLEALAEGRVGLDLSGPDPRVAASLLSCLLPWSRSWRLPAGAQGRATTALVLAGS